MEVTKADLKKFKLSPTLIIFLKALHLKDSKYLEELSKVVNIELIAKHLQSKMIIKILDNQIGYRSFTIRNLDIIKYFNEETSISLSEAKKIFAYFIDTIEKASNKKSSRKFQTFKSFLSSRVNQGVDFDTAKEIIDMKFEEWWGSDYQHHLNFQTLLGSKHYAQYVQQLDMREEKVPEMNINKMI